MKLIIPVLDYPFSSPFWKLNNPDNTVFKNFSKEKWDFFFILTYSILIINTLVNILSKDILHFFGIRIY